MQKILVPVLQVSQFELVFGSGEFFFDTTRQVPCLIFFLKYAFQME